MPEADRYQFGPFTLQPARRLLTRDGTHVELGSRAMDVLLALVRRHGEVATKTDIMDEVWPGVIVEENNLTTQIATVRKALGESANSFIQTVPGRGYRFVAAVTTGETTPAAATPSGSAPTAAAPGLAAEPEPAAERHNLPLESSSFIGRQRELDDIRQRLATRALVTLVGAGGVGKTRVALKLASDMLDSFADGVLLLELAPLSEPHLVAEALCRLLGAPVTGDRPAEAMALAVLRQKRMLLVFDNCEHVLASAAALAAALLRHCPGIRILATSQEALGVAGEAVFPLPSLEVPTATGRVTAEIAMRSDSVRLFAERAADALGSFTLSDEDAPAVAVICRRLDGVPLATELAAARLRMLKPAEIAARLEDVFRLLTGGSRSALPRQQTLRATIDWSVSLLSPAEQTVLRRLSVFVDGTTLEGATAVAAGDGIDALDMFDLVSALVGKSLLVADTSGHTTRYRMLETTRQYAAEKLRHADDTTRRATMAAYMHAYFRRAEAAWPTTPTEAWVAQHGPEVKNLRAAIDWAFSQNDPALGIALVAQSGAISDEMSLQPDLQRWTSTALQFLTPATPKAEAAAILYLHTMGVKRLGTQTVPEERLRAITLFREAGDTLGLSRALRQTAIAGVIPGGDVTAQLAMLEEAAALLRPLAPHKDLATTLAHIGGAHFLAGNREASRRVSESALAMRRALGDRSGVLASSVNLAELIFLEGDVDGALRYAAEAETEARACNAVATLALILSNSAGYRLHAGDAAAAARCAREALALSRAIGQADLAAMCLEHLALVLALTGEPERAAAVLGFTQARFAATGQVREWLEQAEYDRLLVLLHAALPDNRLAGLLAEGAGWTAESVDATALRASVAAAPRPAPPVMVS
jgi:predicted ATPase/DNA-binding winged helix-turn-helix (wHTH) protein